MAEAFVDREKWDALWRGRVNRRLLALPKIEVARNLDFGAVTACTIAADPPACAEMNYRQHDDCPVCGLNTIESERRAASICPTFESGFSYQMGVWIHPDCLADCPETSELAPIPW